MIPTMKCGALIASMLLIMPFAAYADQGSNASYTTQMLQGRLASLACGNAYTTGYLNAVVTIINNSTTTATLSGDITKLGVSFSALQNDANNGDMTQYKTDTKTYTADSKQANLDTRAILKTMHSKSINSELKSQASQLRSEQKGCMFTVKQQQSQLKIQMFNKSLLHAENMTSKMAKHGVNTEALNQTLNTANAQVQAFQLAVQNSQNSTQLQAALNSFCLYDGCKDPNNFHFAAKTTIETNQAKLNILATKNNTSSYQALVSQGQTDLTTAQNELNGVGSNKYRGTQSSDIWNNIKAASDIIHHLQQIINHRS